MAFLLIFYILFCAFPTIQTSQYENIMISISLFCVRLFIRHSHLFRDTEHTGQRKAERHGEYGK